MSTMSKLIAFTIFILFMVVILYNGMIQTNMHCNEILNEGYYGIIRNKVKDSQNHGEVFIYYIDIVSRQKYMLGPSSTGRGWPIFDKIEIGDTLKKESGVGLFYILNYPKRDSVIFNCDR